MTANGRPKGRAIRLANEKALVAAGLVPVLTPRQLQTYAIVVQYHGRHGYGPTVREVGEALGGVQPNGVHGLLRKLVVSGLVRHEPRRGRTYQPTHSIGLYADEWPKKRKGKPA